MARGKGLADEASRLLLRFAFNTLGLHRVFLQVNVTNQSAISLYRRLGFVEEGILRAASFADGRLVDRLLLSMLSHEFPGPLASAKGTPGLRKDNCCFQVY